MRQRLELSASVEGVLVGLAQDFPGVPSSSVEKNMNCRLEPFKGGASFFFLSDILTFPRLAH